MNVALAVLALPPALALGSFLNVVAARLPEGRSLAHPPSACRSCGSQIAWRDNVPVVSYLLLRGRCRTCGVRIGARYLAVELMTAFLVTACFLSFGLTADAFLAAFFCSTLVVLSAIDFERRILPDKIVLPSAAHRSGGAARAPSGHVAGVDPRAAGSGGVPLRSAARLPEGHGDGRREALPPPRCHARQARPRRAHDRNGRGSRTRGHPARPPRRSCSQDGHPVRALSSPSAQWSRSSSGMPSSTPT